MQQFLQRPHSAAVQAVPGEVPSSDPFVPPTRPQTEETEGVVPHQLCSRSLLPMPLPSTGIALVLLRWSCFRESRRHLLWHVPLTLLAKTDGSCLLLSKVGCPVGILLSTCSCLVCQQAGGPKEKLCQRHRQEGGCVWVGQHVSWSLEWLQLCLRSPAKGAGRGIAFVLNHW